MGGGGGGGGLESHYHPRIHPIPIPILVDTQIAGGGEGRGWDVTETMTCPFSIFNIDEDLTPSEVVGPPLWLPIGALDRGGVMILHVDLNKL